jgi:hypothetical protein
MTERVELLLKDNEDFANVLRTPEGARVIAGLVDFCGTFDVNPSGNLYKEGMRHVGLMLYRRVLGAPGGEAVYAAARDRRRAERCDEEKEEYDG